MLKILSIIHRLICCISGHPNSTKLLQLSYHFVFKVTTLVIVYGFRKSKMENIFTKILPSCWPSRLIFGGIYLGKVDEVVNYHLCILRTYLMQKSQINLIGWWLIKFSRKAFCSRIDFLLFTYTHLLTTFVVD